MPETSDLTIAVRVARKILAEYGDPAGYDVYAYAQAHGALSEALRLVLQAVSEEGRNG